MLSIQNLKLGYGKDIIVNMPALELKAGEHCLITGKSGVGKTTLLYGLAGLLTPLSGSILLENTELTALPAAKMDSFRGQHIGIIYQTLHVVRALSVLQNVLLAQYAAGVKQDAARAQALLDELGIGGKANEKPNALSQGQQQRLAIARAAVNAPKIILGDEPTSALDDEACETAIKLLLAMAKKSNATLIVASHDARITPHFTKQIKLGGAA